MSIENLKLGKLLSTKMEEKKETACLSDNTLSEFIENKLPFEERGKVLEHLNSCHDCFDVYKITSSTLADLKKARKINITRSLSIAASIMFVFFIGFYYSNFYKTQPEEKLEFQTKRIKRDISSVEAELSKEESFQNRQKDKETDRNDAKGSLKNSSEKKIRTKEKPLKMIIGDDVKPELKANLDGVDITKSRPIEGGIGEKSKYGKNTASTERNQINQKKERGSRKAQTVVEMEEKTLNDEYIVRKPSVFKKNKISKSSEMRFKTEHIKDTGKWKKKSNFSILSKLGFVYKTKNRFGKLNNDQVLILLSKWKKILPGLSGSERDIALETINYLQIKKQKIQDENDKED